MNEWAQWLLVVCGACLLMAVVAFIVSLPFAFIGWIVLSVIGIFVDFMATYTEYVATGIIISLIIAWRVR